MSTRSEALSRKVEQANTALLQAIEASTPEQWEARCATGDWTQGFAAYHAATSIGNIATMVKGIASGAPFEPVERGSIDERNADFLKAHPNPTMAEAIEMARTNSPAAVQMVAGLTDAELDRQAALLVGMPPASVEQVIEMLLVGHPSGHREAIVQAR